MRYDVIVVGAGIAGMTAAIYLRRAGYTVLVVESKVAGGQIVNTVGIENWPGAYGISGAKLSEEIYHQMDKLGAEIEYALVESVDSTGVNGDFVVRTDDGEYSCGAIIIAVGTEPRKLSAKQAADAGARPISYCATCDGALYKDKPVVVVGSGNTAKHEISYLKKICSKVYYIHHDDPIPKEAEAVFVAIGRVPETGAFDGLVKMDADGYIEAGEDCKTSCPGVFVAGDCRTKEVRQLVTAAGDGAIATASAVAFLSERKASKET